jgi:hypothetical protein
MKAVRKPICLDNMVKSQINGPLGKRAMLLRSRGNACRSGPRAGAGSDG